MKNLKYFFLAVIALAGCSGYSQKTTDVVKIEFTSMTRGFNKQIVITKDSVVTTSAGRGSDGQNKRIKLNSKQWEHLMASMEEVSFSKIPDLKSPTEKRMYDGARHSTITITAADGTAVSHLFDDEMPNQKLQKLMKEISKLEKSIQ